ncbi:hypothetical protein FG379_003713 [Cryptosporidium bovis]|uniref:uncharacterized protein n=1 Tax=Cryptosporidium bovis TaxID=310047 RepID=UPI00351A62A0|nr:hypothetical protein FG379_003713 [Cryptosporidium bovis]
MGLKNDIIEDKMQRERNNNTGVNNSVKRRHGGRSYGTRVNNKWSGNNLCGYYSEVLEVNEMGCEADLGESFNVIRGFCLCEGYNLESLRLALDKHNYYHWYVDKEKSILVFDLIPYFNKLEVTWATQGKTGLVLFPAGIYGSRSILQVPSNSFNLDYMLYGESLNLKVKNECKQNSDLNDLVLDGINNNEKQKLLSDNDYNSNNNKKIEYETDIIDTLEKGENMLDKNYWKRLENPIFVFKNGVVIAWCNEEVGSNPGTHFVNSPKKSDERLDDVLAFLSLYSIKSFSGKHSKKCQYKTMLYKYGNFAISRLYKSNRKMISDVVNLKTRSAEEKLAFSLSIRQSIRLSLFENFIDDCVASIKYLPLKLAQVGAYSVVEEEYKVKMPQIRKKFSELYSYQIEVNLVEDFLDIPELFWHNCKFHSTWSSLQEHLRISERFEVLNRRIVMMQELLKVITEEYQTNQANRLTWIVIILLTINCFASGIRHIFFHSY